MNKKLTSNEKCNIRTMAMFIQNNSQLTQVIKDIKTGSYEYMVVAEYDSNKGCIGYYVRKINASGRFIGTISIIRISDYGIEYNHLDDGKSLPDSVAKALVTYNKTLNLYMSIGEKALG